MSKLRNLIPNRPTEAGRALGDELARLTENATAKLLADGKMVKAPCKSCAFRRGTVPNGCEETVMDAIKCVMQGDRQFMCHEVPHGQEPNEVCGGYAIAKAYLGDSPPITVPWEYSPDYLPDGFLCSNSEVDA